MNIAIFIALVFMLLMSIRALAEAIDRFNEQ